MAGILGTILGAVGSVVPSVVNALSNKTAVQNTNQAQMDLAKYQFDANRQMIAEQNAYNSPASQMARYQAAGLNPNLIYGNGSSSAGNQSGVASYQAPNLQAPHYDFSNMLNNLSLALQLKGMQLDNENKQREADNKFYQGQVYQAQALSYDLDNSMKRWQLGDFEMDFAPETSPFVRKYMAEVSGLEYLNQLRQSQEALNQLSASEKRFYNTNILPLLLTEQSYSNSLLKKELDAFWWKFGVDAGTSVARAITPFVGGKFIHKYISNKAPWSK